MATHPQRWFLLCAAILLIAIGCVNLAQAFGNAPVPWQLALGLFYSFAGGTCMCAHVREVTDGLAGDAEDDEERWASP